MSRMVESVLSEARQYVDQANECFAEARSSADAWEVLTLTRLGQAFLDTADELRRKVEATIEADPCTEWMNNREAFAHRPLTSPSRLGVPSALADPSAPA
jgi:hypothetical protein